MRLSFWTKNNIVRQCVQKRTPNRIYRANISRWMFVGWKSIMDSKGWRKWRRGSSETCLEYQMTTRNKVSTRICYWCRKLLWLLPFLHKNAHYKIQVWVPRIEFFALEFMIGTYITLAMMPFWITEQQNYALLLRCDAAWRPREA